ncbi:MAG: AAA family ATPase [Cyanobacteriota bacterium]|nr:AAA family ATPase [Cyanobacteriota bacterium]
MINPLAGYKTTGLIYDGTRTLVYRGIKEKEQRAVVIKKSRQQYPTFNELLQLRHQYALTKNLEITGIVKPIALEKEGNSYVLVMEDVGGISLSQYYQNRPLNLEEFFSVAIAITKILARLYRHRVIHKDIKPSNILINPETKEIFLIDFSISSLLPRETGQLQNPNAIEGSLAYISPEQSGRMNRGIDYRSDFYSLGVTFYQLLTGQLPFKSQDPMELLHCHIAKRPTPPHALKAEIPEMVSAIVMKLMAKTAEERYQSAKGLERDLTECMQQWQKSGKIDRFELGQRDRSDRFIIPEKLYGRETEVQTLLEAFSRVAAGSTEMILVAGFSGVGKTAIVSEVHKPIVEKRGYFILGKFDQFNRNIPLSAFAIAFRDLMGQLLGESDTAIKKWKAEILSALGEQAKVIIDAIPELEHIIGVQPNARELSGSAAQNRFNLLFGKFIRVFATKEHPLVIFLDDLQWADSASLKSIQLLLGETGISDYLLLIGAYRDNEVSLVHPLMLTLEEIGKTGARVNSITIAPLPQTEINRLVADTLSCTPDLAQPLTELVYEKAKGNPFFTNQFLKSLHEDGWIEFNFEVGYWQCDITQVRELSLTDDAVELMAGRISKLPTATRSLLKLAACIGNQFDLETLAIVSELSQTEAAASLWVALREGLVLPLDFTYKFYQEEGAGEESERLTVAKERTPRYKFLHDRVQQAAYFLIPEAEKQRTHLQIGRLLSSNTAPSNREAQIFAIVSQLNLGAGLIEEAKEREDLARLNLMAARKAKASTAYQSAIENLKTALQCLAEDCWEKQYQLTRDLYEQAALVSYLMGDFEGSELYGKEIIERGKTILEKIEVFHITIQSELARQNLNEAIELGLAVLERLGIVLETEPPSLEEIEAVQNLPDMTDPYKLAALKILDSIGSVSFSTNQTLMKQVIYTSLHLSVKYGNSILGTISYVDYSLILCGIDNDVERGYSLGKMGLELFMERFSERAKEQISVILHTFNGSVRHWQEPLENTLASCLEALNVGLENGEIIYSGYEIILYIGNLWLLGESLESIAVKCQSYIEILEKHNLIFHVDFARLYHQAALNLLGSSESSAELIGEAFNETEKLPIFKEYSIGIALFFIYALKGQLAYLFGDIEASINWTEEARKWRENANGFFLVAVNQFYFCLALLNACADSSPQRQREIISQVESDQKQMQYWARHARANFQHKYDLIEAEKAKVLGGLWEAAELYDRAITGAAENKFLSEEALANELAAKFYLDWGKEKVAAGYMQDAYYCYAGWGAKAKIADLERRYPQLLAPLMQSPKTDQSSSTSISQITRATVTSTTMGSNSLLDFSSAFKASMAISGEIELFGLLSKLMQVVMENAGATKSVLLLPKGDTLVIEAMAGYNEAGIIEMMSLGRSLPGPSSKDIPQSIVNTVKRTREVVVVNDVSKETRFASEVYLVKCQARSILCMPLNDGGQLRGILYLENDVTAGVFSGDRLEVLKLIAAQAAISLQNVRLYQDLENANQTLEQKVEERTQELNEKNQRLKATLEELKTTQGQLIQTEKMSSLGRMVGGIAHEINNPTSFIFGNLHHAKDYVRDLLDLIEVYRQDFPDGSDRVWDKIEEIDLDYIKEDTEQLFSSMKNGCDRIRTIVEGLRTFSRLDESKTKAIDVNASIESTMLLLLNRLRNSRSRSPVEVLKQYGNLPKVTCYASQVNQVLFHIINNAIDALNSKPEYPPSNPPTIKIITETVDGQTVKITISDNGEGMKEETLVKIFDPFFTTKPVGQGTGLGLSTSYQIIAGEHGGNLTCSSELGKGTEFVITLPVFPLK